MPRAKSNNSLALVFKIIVALALFFGALGLGALGLGALGLGALGACVLFAGSMSGGSTATNATSGANFYFGLAALLAVLGVAWTVFWILKKQ